MAPLLRQFRDFFVSLKLTVVLLVLSIVLIFWATIAQVNLGIWGVQEKFFRTFFVLERLPGTQIPVPVFPGGYFIGGLLLINLIAAHVYRFEFSWKKLGIQLAHAGIIVLLLGELLTGLLQRESAMELRGGETKSFSEDFRLNELAIIDSSAADHDEVVAIPEARIEDGGTVQHPRLPFAVRLLDYYPNAAVLPREQVPSGFKPIPSPADRGLGPKHAVFPLRPTFRQDQRNLPATFVQLSGAEGTIGTWLVSPMLREEQSFEYQGKKWRLALRPKRYYTPHSIQALQVTHEIYPGTDIPKNFATRARVRDAAAGVDREVVIYMNNPLRHGGQTYYQYQMDKASNLTVFQVVRNPGWLLPYVACVMMGSGLVIQFLMSLG